MDTKNSISLQKLKILKTNFFFNIQMLIKNKALLFKTDKNIAGFQKPQNKPSFKFF